MDRQAHGRSFVALLGSVILASSLSCSRGNQPPESQVTRRGGDVVATGSMATIMDSVPGDAILASGDVSFGGVTGGDYLGAGGKQTIAGRIHGSLRAAGGDVHVTALVDRNASILGGRVALDSAGIIAGNAYVIGGMTQIDGTVHGSILASGGAIVLNGVVGHDVDIAAGTLSIGPHAQIAGNVRYRVREAKVHIDPAARIAGSVTALPVSTGRRLWHWVWILGFFVLGAVAVATLPRFMAEAAEILPQRPGRSALVGLGWAILVPIAICVAAVTIIGIPLALLATAVYLMLVCLGSVPFSVWLGQLVLGVRARKGREGALVSFLVGGFLLLVVAIIPIVGGWVSLVAWILGVGTILLQARTVRERQPAGV
jgi:hypothetical protein